MINLKINFQKFEFKNELEKQENETVFQEIIPSQTTQTFLSIFNSDNQAKVDSSEPSTPPAKARKMTCLGHSPRLEQSIVGESSNRSPFPFEFSSCLTPSVDAPSLLSDLVMIDLDSSVISDLGERRSKTKRKLFSSLEEEELKEPSPVSEFSDIEDFMALIDKEEDIEGDSIIFKSLEKQKAFFTSKEPEQWFPLKMDENQKVAIAFSETAGKIKKLIYVFRNKESNALLIGKTGQSFADRMGGYKHNFNTSVAKNEKEDITEENQRANGFVADVQDNPANFEVGILYALRPEEDLNDFETLFIEHKKTLYPLYNQREGGGGGLARSEEKPTTYAIPKPGTIPFTPPKRYPLKEDGQGRIRPQFSPGFYKYFKELSESRTDLTQGFVYSIKDLTGKKEYCGGTGQKYPPNRFNQHCYKAEVFNPRHVDKYSPLTKDGRLHPLMGEKPESFGVNFLPVVYDISKIPDEEKENYDIVTTLGDAEKLAIVFKKSLVSQGGLNCNKGNGGPIADPKKKKAVFLKNTESVLGKKRKAGVL